MTAWRDMAVYPLSNELIGGWSRWLRRCVRRFPVGDREGVELLLLIGGQKRANLRLGIGDLLLQGFAPGLHLLLDLGDLLLDDRLDLGFLVVGEREGLGKVIED